MGQTVVMVGHVVCNAENGETCSVVDLFSHQTLACGSLSMFIDGVAKGVC